MEFLIIFVIGLVITLAFASRTGERVRNKFDIDTQIVYLEEKRDIMTVEEKKYYITIINDYRNKQSSAKLTSPLWLTRVNAKSELEEACKTINDFYAKIKLNYGE
jgi:hypothetical protein